MRVEFTFATDDEDWTRLQMCEYTQGEWSAYLFDGDTVALPRNPKTKGDLRQLMRGFGQEI